MNELVKRVTAGVDLSKIRTKSGRGSGQLS